MAPLELSPSDAQDVQEHKDLAALSYAWIVSVILLIAKRESRFVHFHAKQGVILFIASILFWFVPVVNRILELIVFFFCCWGFFSASQGRWTELPFAGSLARGKLSFRGSWKELLGALLGAKHWVIGLWKHHDPDEKNIPNHDTVSPTVPPADRTSTSTGVRPSAVGSHAHSEELHDIPPLEGP